MIDYRFENCFSDKFPYQDCKELYEEFNKKYIYKNFDYSFEDLMRNIGQSGFLYACFVDDIFSGCIYFHNFKEKTCFVTGFAKRKNAKYSAKALNILCDVISTKGNLIEIFAEVEDRHVSLFLLKAGFKKTNNNIYSRKGVI